MNKKETMLHLTGLLPLRTFWKLLLITFVQFLKGNHF